MWTIFFSALDVGQYWEGSNIEVGGSGVLKEQDPVSLKFRGLFGPICVSS